MGTAAASVGNGVARSIVRVAGALVLVGAVGFLLGGCGGGGGTGSALTTRTGATVTRTQPTIARPTAPTTTEAAPTTTHATTTVATTVQVTTTAPRPTTTRPPLTVTVVPPTTSTVAATTTSPTPVAAPPTTTSAAAEPASSSETPWGWIALVLALTALGVVGIVLWGRRRSQRQGWSAHYADLRRRTLITLDDVVAQGSVVAGQVEALAGEARDLERHGAGEQETAAVAPVRAALDELAEALEADRTLRLATPPPTPEQLAYSEALIRQQVTQLQGTLRSP